ncbi:MAG: hypothetical protein OXP36_12885 [Gammaproteobacteria bacterium]|nr:hypothetical protein [Gammaproteobacteria bacterium]
MSNGDSTANAATTYSDRITKLLPAEFVGVYLTATQIVNAGDLGSRQPSLLICLALCLLLIPVYMSRIKGITDRSHQCVIALSFLVWAYALGDAFQPGAWIQRDLYNPVFGAVLLAVWGLVPLVLDIGPRRENQCRPG